MNISSSKNRNIGVVLTYINMFINLIIGIFLIPIMTNKMGASEYGIFSIATALISMLSAMDLGFNQTMVRFFSKFKSENNIEEERKLFGFFLKMYLFISVGVFITGFVVIVNLTSFYGQSLSIKEIYILKIVLSILLVNIVISFPLCVFNGLLNSYENFIILRLVNVLSTLFKYFGYFIILNVGYKSIGIAIVTSVTSLTSQVFLVFYTLRVIQIRPSFELLEKNIKKEIYNFSFYIFLNTIVGLVFDNLDKILLGKFSGTLNVSIYTIGMQFITYFSDLSLAISGVYLPYITDLFIKRRNSEISVVFNKIARIQFLLLSFVIIGFLFYGYDFVYLWVGSSYTNAYYIALMLMSVSIINLTQNIGVTVLRAMNLHRYRTYTYIVASIVNVCFSIPLILRYNEIGATIGTIIANIVVFMVMDIIYSIRLQLDIKKYWLMVSNVLLKEIPIYIICIFLNALLPSLNWGTLCIKILITISVSVCIFWNLILNYDDKKLILGFLKRRNNI